MAEHTPANVPVALPKKKGFPRAFGHYVLERSLSRGGMGEIFLAVPKSVTARCVIKTIRADLTGDKEFVGRFADEAKIMTRIAHKNIIRIFDCGKVNEDYYIAMEFVHGRDLGDILDRAYERGEPMPRELGIFAAKQLLHGLDYIHNVKAKDGRPMRLVHRDISPQNVLVGFDASMKLIDFGLARTELLPGRTQGALAVGKYGYMSPEQARHEKLDGRADLYSLGVMLFEVFTGDRLVDEQDQATLWSRVLNPKHRSPRSVLGTLPAEIDELIMRAVAVKPEDRFGDALAMLDFANGMKTRCATREEWAEYLDYLYPNADKKPPPVPDFSNFSDGNEGEYSMVIAMSEEGAKSVFGRGVLPVEFTRQVNVAELLPELDRRRREVDDYHPDATLHDAAALENAVRQQVLVTTDDQRAELSVKTGGGDGALPKGILADNEATAYARPPAPRAPSDDTRASPRVEARGKFRDDEATVMMDAPLPAASPLWAGDELTAEEQEGPTAIRKHKDGPRKSGPPAPSPLRAIKEINRQDEPPSVAIRATVPQAAKPSRRRLETDTLEDTVPPSSVEPPAPNWLLLGLILMAITIIILLIVLIMQK